VPLQFTPFLGILAGIVLTLLIIILAIILVIRLKYKYGKRCPRNSINSDSDQDANYRSFKFEKNPNMISGRITPGNSITLKMGEFFCLICFLSD
jgi:hypothetical protein